MNNKPQPWISSFVEHLDGTYECVCFWCKEPILFFPEDTIAVVQTKDGAFAGLQCQQCLKDYAGQHAQHSVHG